MSAERIPYPMKWRPLISWIVLLASLLLTVVATWTIAGSAYERDQARFANAVQGTRNQIASRLETYIALLRGGAGLFAASDEGVSYADFRDYADRLDLGTRYKGIQGFGFSQRVRPAQRDSLAAAMRAADFLDFEITPPGEGERHAIIYLQPVDARNRRAIGFDMFSDSTRREAMARAWRTGSAAMSGKVELVQEIAGPRQAGFLIYLPVYRGGGVPGTEAQRLAALDGFVYAPFRADDLFSGTLGTGERSRVAYRIYDGNRAAPPPVLHDSETVGIRAVRSPRFEAQTSLVVAGRTWTIVFNETDVLAAGFWASSAPLVALIGLVVSVLLFLLSRAQVRAEESLRESEGRLREVMESLPVGVLVADAEGQITFTNAAVHRIWYGATAGAMPVTADERFVAQDWGLHRALHGHPAAGRVIEVTGRDGQRRALLNSAFPLRDSARHVRMAIAVLVDITEQKHAEALMREREREFSTLANAIPQLAWMADEKGDVFWFNDRWYDYTGTTLDEARGSGWTRVPDPSHAPRIIERFRHHVETGEPWEDLYPLRGETGEYRWFLSMASPVRDEHGRVLRWVGTHTDMTQQVKTQQAEARAIREQAAREAAESREEQIRAQAEELARSNRELQDFAYVASHDLQEPLRKITAFSDLLQREYGAVLDEQGVFYLERMQQAALRMSRLIKDLLAFSRVTTRTRPFAPVNLNDVLTEVKSDLGIRIQETGGRVEGADLPTFEADVMQMRQLFQNLVGNALKFHRPGVPPVVTVRAERCSSKLDAGAACAWRIEVADNGIGFDEKYLDRIFSPFQRLHTQAEYEGTGIGLAICRRIVERHGGTITATSTPGEGSTFAITLPVQASETSAAPD